MDFLEVATYQRSTSLEWAPGVGCGIICAYLALGGVLCSGAREGMRCTYPCLQLFSTILVRLPPRLTLSLPRQHGIFVFIITRDACIPLNST